MTTTTTFFRPLALVLSFGASLLLAGCGDNTDVASATDNAPLLAIAPTDIVEGDENAPITIIEYASMTCSHCAAFHLITYPELKKKYIDTGKVRFVLREFPLDEYAAAAFVTAHCLGDENYYASVDLLFGEQGTWIGARPENRQDALAAMARKAGIGRSQFDSCYNDESVYERVKSVQEGGRNLGIRSTPTFFIDGKKFAGALPIEKFDEVLAPLLPAEKTPPSPGE